MRILLTSNASYDPPRGGSTRSNLAWLEQLAARGHVCRVVCAAAEGGHGSRESVGPAGIRILSVADLTLNASTLRHEIQAFAPDWVLVSSEDVGHVLLREASGVAAERLVYLAHTPQFLPFGPASWHRDPRATEMIRQARAVVAIGRHMAGYVEQHCGRPADVVHPPIYGEPPYPRLSAWDRGDILMVNPCQVKGIQIFVEAARRLPELHFAALRGWGTTGRDRAALAELPNVKFMEPVGRIDEVLANARVLLMPSLWYEGFGLIAMEAMLRGLPVISSDSGGLMEAKQGTGYVIPVRPIEQYEPIFDENHMPRAKVPEQDIEPWVAALRELVGSPEAYLAEAERSRGAGLEFVESIRPEALEELLESLGQPRKEDSRKPLRILLAHNSLYYPSHGGGDRSNRLLMEALAARGHSVRVVARVEEFSAESHHRLLEYLVSHGVAADTSASDAIRMNLSGVDVHTLTRSPNLRAYFRDQVAAFHPDIIITSTDDPAQILFGAAVAAPQARVVHLVRATIALPFGPDASTASAERTAALQQADGIVGVSEYVARYVRQQSKLDAIHLPISLMEPAESPRLGAFDNPYVLIVNPCAVKGLSIFLELAARMPHLQFAAVPTWGTNAQDFVALRRQSNIRILEPSDKIDDILRQTRVLLVPSLWAEARSRIVVEAMARGVPVIASAVGGIPEAMLGVDYLIPVNLITRYRPAVDEHMVPVAEVPPQDIGPWEAALARLTTDRAHYDALASEARRAALGYIDGLSAEPFEAYLYRVLRQPKRAVPASIARDLSPDRQRLLTLLMRRKLWFPALEKSTLPRLFCFSHAGGGTHVWKEWQGALEGLVSVCPVRLPGRENRVEEKPFTQMEPLVDALLDAMTPHLAQPFLFLGASLGAALAFELTRALRRRGQVQPIALVVAAARAPQFRLGHVPQPEPADAELLEQLRRLDGMPAEFLENPDLLRLALPALRADTRLYRDYSYSPEDPLTVPIIAYGGDADPNLRAEHIDAWRQQTTGLFLHREFRGGHFFLEQARREVWRALREDLMGILGQSKEVEVR